MSGTVKIPKSKNALYKKVNFLYLVFIVFIFLSSTGNFVVHYTHLQSTQKAYNAFLLEQIKGADLQESKQSEALRDKTIAYVDYLNSSIVQFNDYFGSSFVQSIEKLKEYSYTDKNLRPSHATYIEFEQQRLAFADFVDQLEGQKGFMASHSTFFSDEIGGDYLFNQLPNAAFPSIIEHFKFAVLSHAYNVLVKELSGGDSLEVSTDDDQDIEEFDVIERAPFIQQFKRFLALGDVFTMNLIADGDVSNSIPKVFIEGLPIGVQRQGDNRYSIRYVPYKKGVYSVQVKYAGENVTTSFEVLDPQFRYLVQASTMDAVVGNEMQISLDTNIVPLSSVFFTSNHGQIRLDKNILYLTPAEKGLFLVQMKHVQSKEVLDELQIEARLPEPLEIGLYDVSGQVTSDITQISKLEVLKRNWSVTGFSLSVYDDDGLKYKLQSSNRLLTPEMRSALSSINSGTTVIFHEIKVSASANNLSHLGKTIILSR